MRRFIALFLALLVIQCAFSLNHDVLPESKDRTAFFTNIAIDRSMSSREILLTKLALTEWNTALAGNLSISYFVTDEPATNCVRVITDIDDVPEIWKRQIEDGGIVLGYVDKTCVNVIQSFVEGLATSNNVSYERMFKTVVLHEFGHYLGMRHVGNSRRLMNRAYSNFTPQCVTIGDAEAACDAIGVPGGDCVTTCGLYSI